MKARLKKFDRTYRRVRKDPLGRWLLCIVYAGLALMTLNIALLLLLERDYDDIVRAAGAK